VNPAQALGDVFYWVFQYPIQWLLEHLHSIFAHGPGSAIGAFGLAVIVTTLIIRVVLFPLFTWQLKTSRRIQAEQRRIAPELQELRKKYKDPQKRNAEMMKLYKEHNINPLSQLSGCLPILVQWPIIGALYRAISAVQGNLHNDLGFLWIHDVSKTGLQTCCTDAAGHVNYLNALSHPTVLILPLMAALATVVQSKMMMPPMRPDMSDQELQMAKVSRQMTLFLPIMVFVFGMIFPAGISLYWVTQSMFMVVQQFIVVGWGGLKVPPWFPGAGRVTALSFPPPPASAAPAAALKGSNNGRAKQPPAQSRGQGGAAPRRPATSGASTQGRQNSGSRRNKRSR
jgi:YidC/Oxa1 family membrane protein insertase